MIKICRGYTKQYKNSSNLNLKLVDKFEQTLIIPVIYSYYEHASTKKLPVVLIRLSKKKSYQNHWQFSLIDF